MSVRQRQGLMFRTEGAAAVESIVQAAHRRSARPKSWGQACAQRCRASASRSCLRINASAPQPLIAAGKSWAS